MQPKSLMLHAILASWMMAAFAVTALPFLHALPALQARGSFATLAVALVIGVVASVPLSIVARRLCDIELPSAATNAWGLFTSKEAALLGVICWGVPVGLIFVVHEFLQASDIGAAIAGLIMWPVVGIAFGLSMRWMARRNGGTRAP